MASTKEKCAGCMSQLGSTWLVVRAANGVPVHLHGRACAIEYLVDELQDWCDIAKNLKANMADGDTGAMEHTMQVLISRGDS